jgi:hypothetical protein
MPSSAASDRKQPCWPSLNPGRQLHASSPPHAAALVRRAHASDCETYCATGSAGAPARLRQVYSEPSAHAPPPADQSHCRTISVCASRRRRLRRAPLGLRAGGGGRGAAGGGGWGAVRGAAGARAPHPACEPAAGCRARGRMRAAAWWAWAGPRRVSRGGACAAAARGRGGACTRPARAPGRASLTLQRRPPRTWHRRRR